MTTAVTTVAILILLAVGSTTSALTVKQLPHLQTFDSWDTCVYDGGCYEQDCAGSVMGGWVTPAFEDVLFLDQTWGWWINSGLTPSNKDSTTRQMLTCGQATTGPCADHTTNATGKYLYAEASGCSDRPFSANTPYIVFTNTSARLSFWYYYNGANFDSSTKLQVSISAATDAGVTNNATIFTKTGTTSAKQWVQANVSLSSYFPSAASAANPITAIFTFRVTPSNSRSKWSADIAIDDVLFTQDGVSASPVPYIDPSPSPSPSPPSGRAAPVTTGGGGLSDAEIGGIVGGVVGGLILLTLLLGVLLVVILLIISPKGPSGPAPAPNSVL